MIYAGTLLNFSEVHNSLLKEKDGSLRFCVDLRKLNAITVTDNFLFPRIDDTFDRLAGSSIFTTLDLKSGYWQVRMSIDSIPKTAFTTTDGQYEFIRLPFSVFDCLLL